jgi:dTDP-4-dehydrorhamnose 3,5-epimerase
MLFHPTTLADALIIEMTPARDERGFFARSFCEREFSAAGLPTRYPQHSLSMNAATGTLRGMHFQRAPHEEAKLVRCAAGAIYDVIVDLRPASPTYLRWEAFELTPQSFRQLYIPPGFAHGFQTLAPDTLVSYLISAFYAPEAAHGYRHDDPAFAISWPLPVAAMSEKDRAWPDYQS